MARFLGFGNSHDGVIPTSGVVNSYASVTGTAGSPTVTTSLTVFAGDIVLLHQSQGTGVGNWELVGVKTPGSGQFTADTNLVNSYGNGAQAVLVPQYSGGVVSGTITGQDWNGTAGGIIVICASGKLTITGSINVNGNGFRGGAGGPASWPGSSASDGTQGEGASGTGSKGNSAANGNGGGGGVTSGDGGPGGGGGGLGASGSAGGNGQGTGGSGGGTDGSSDLTDLVLGGGGGGGGGEKNGTGIGGTGGDGSGIVIIFASEIDVSAGYIYANGNTGEAGTNPQEEGAGGGGGGSGGDVLIKTKIGTMGTSRVIASAGSGGASPGSASGDGGAGGAGRRRIEACVITGSGYADSEVEGGQDWCGAVASVIGG